MFFRHLWWEKMLSLSCNSPLGVLSALCSMFTGQFVSATISQQECFKLAGCVCVCRAEWAHVHQVFLYFCVFLHIYFLVCFKFKL